LIFLETNKTAETLREKADASVIAWLVWDDAEPGLPSVTIAGRAFAFHGSGGDGRW